MVKAIKKSSSSAAATATATAEAETPDDDLCIHIYEHFSQKNMILPEGSKTLFAGNIACPPGRKITQADFEKFFRKVGKVVNVQIKFYGNEKVVELAEIEFESHDVAKEALKKMNNRELFGTLVCLDVSREGSGPRYNETDCTSQRPAIHIAFGELFTSYNLQNRLEAIFKSCGEIKFVSVAMNEDEEDEEDEEDKEDFFSPEFAYIVFKDFESLSKALGLDGTEFMGAPMKIRRAKVYVTSW